MAADVSNIWSARSASSRRTVSRTLLRRIWLCSRRLRSIRKRLRRWGILCAMDQPDRAAVYDGMLFDLLVEPRDEIKALAIYNRFSRPVRISSRPNALRAMLSCNKNRIDPDEAIEQYSRAAEIFRTRGGRRRAVLLGTDGAARSGQYSTPTEAGGSRGEDGKNALAARAFLRAGQLASASGATAEALNLLAGAQTCAARAQRCAALRGRNTVNRRGRGARRRCSNRLRRRRGRTFSRYVCRRADAGGTRSGARSAGKAFAREK